MTWRVVAGATTSSEVRVGSAIFLFGWLALALLLAPAPASLAGRDRFYLTPLLPLFALGPTAIVLAALGLSPALRRTLRSVSLPAIHAVQLYRVIGGIFLVLIVEMAEVSPPELPLASLPLLLPELPLVDPVPRRGNGSIEKITSTGTSK